MKDQHRFRFISFHDRIAAISLNPINHVDFTSEILEHTDPANLNVSGQSFYYNNNKCISFEDSNSEEHVKKCLYEDLSRNFFSATLNYWLQKVSNEEFVQLAKKLKKYSQSLPHLMIHFSEVIEALSNAIRTWKSYTALEPVYHLLAILPRDVQEQFSQVLPFVFDTLIDSMDSQNPDSLEFTFYTLASLFRCLSGLIIKNFKYYLNLYRPWLVNKSTHVRLFAAESLSYLLRKAVPEDLPNLIQTVIQFFLIETAYENVTVVSSYTKKTEDVSRDISESEDGISSSPSDCEDSVEAAVEVDSDSESFNSAASENSLSNKNDSQFDIPNDILFTPSDESFTSKNEASYLDVKFIDRNVKIPFINSNLLTAAESALFQTIGSLLFETVKNVNSTFNSKVDIVLDSFLQLAQTNEFTQHQWSSYKVIASIFLIRMKNHVKLFPKANIVHEKLEYYFLREYAEKIKLSCWQSFWFCQFSVEIVLQWLFGPPKSKQFPLDFLNNFLSVCLLPVSKKCFKISETSETLFEDDRKCIFNVYITETLFRWYGHQISPSTLHFFNDFDSLLSGSLLGFLKLIETVFLNVSISPDIKLTCIKRFIQILSSSFMHNDSELQVWVKCLQFVDVYLKEINPNILSEIRLKLKQYTNQLSTKDIYTLSMFYKYAAKITQALQQQEEFQYNPSSYSVRFSRQTLADICNQWESEKSVEEDLVYVGCYGSVLHKNEYDATNDIKNLWETFTRSLNTKEVFLQQPLENLARIGFWILELFHSVLRITTVPNSEDSVMLITNVFQLPKHVAKLSFLSKLEHDVDYFKIWLHPLRLCPKSYQFVIDGGLSPTILSKEILNLLISLNSIESNLDTEKIKARYISRIEQLLYQCSSCSLTCLALQYILSLIWDVFRPVRLFAINTLSNCIVNKFHVYSNESGSLHLFYYWIIQQVIQEILRAAVMLSFEMRHNADITDQACSHDDQIAQKNLKSKKGFIVDDKKLKQNKRFVGTTLSHKVNSIQEFYNQSIYSFEERHEAVTDPTTRFMDLSKLLRCVISYFPKIYPQTCYRDFLDIQVKQIYEFIIGNILSLLNVSCEALDLEDDYIQFWKDTSDNYMPQKIAMLTETMNWLVEMGPSVFNYTQFKPYRDILLRILINCNCLLCSDSKFQLSVIKILSMSRDYGETIKSYQQNIESFITENNTQLIWLNLSWNNINSNHQEIIIPILIRIIIAKLYAKGAKRSQQHQKLQKQLVSHFHELPITYVPNLFVFLFKDVVQVTHELYVNEKCTELKNFASRLTSEEWLLRWFQHIVQYTKSLPASDWFWKYDYDYLLGRWVWDLNGQLILQLKELLKPRTFNKFALYLSLTELVIELKSLIATVDIFVAQFISTVIALLDPVNEYESQISKERIKRVIRTSVKILLQLIQNHFQCYDKDKASKKDTEKFNWKLGIFCSCLYNCQTTIHTMLKLSIQNGHLSSTLKFVCWFGQNFDRIQLLNNGLPVVFPIIWEMLSSPAIVLHARNNKPLGPAFDYVMNFLQTLLTVKPPENFTTPLIQKCMIRIACRSKAFREEFMVANNLLEHPESGNDSENTSVQYAIEYCRKFLPDLKFQDPDTDPELRRNVNYPYGFHVTGPVMLEPYVDKILLQLYNILSLKSSNKKINWNVYLKYFSVIKSLASIANVTTDTVLVLVIRLFVSILPSVNDTWIGHSESVANRLMQIFDILSHFLSRLSLVIARCKVRAENSQTILDLLNDIKFKLNEYLKTLYDLNSRKEMAYLLITVELCYLEIINYRSGLNSLRVSEILKKLKDDINKISCDDLSLYVLSKQISEFPCFKEVSYVKVADSPSLEKLNLAFLLVCLCSVKPRSITLEPYSDLHASIFVALDAKMNQIPLNWYRPLVLQIFFFFKHPTTDWATRNLAQTFLQSSVINRLAKIATLRKNLSVAVGATDSQLIAKASAEYKMCTELHNMYIQVIYPSLIQLMSFSPKEQDFTGFRVALELIFYIVSTVSEVYDFLPTSSSEFLDWSQQPTIKEKTAYFYDLLILKECTEIPLNTFQCLLHIQKHHRVEGLSRLSVKLQDLSMETIQNIILPLLLESMVQISTKAAFSLSLSEKSLSLLMKICFRINWSTFKKLLKLLSKTLKSPNLSKTQETFLIKAICGTITNYFNKPDLVKSRTNQQRAQEIFPLLQKLGYTSKSVASKDKFKLESVQKHTIRPNVIATQIQLLKQLPQNEFEKGLNNIIQKLMYFFCSKNRLLRKKVQTAVYGMIELMNTDHFVILIDSLYSNLYSRDINPNLISILFYTIKNMLEIFVFDVKFKGSMLTKPIKLESPGLLRTLHEKIFDLVLLEFERLCDCSKITSQSLKRVSDDLLEVSQKLDVEEKVIHEARSFISGNVLAILSVAATTEGINDIIRFIWNLLTGEIIKERKKIVFDNVSVDKKYMNLLKIVYTQVYNGIAQNKFLDNKSKFYFLYSSFKLTQQLGLEIKTKSTTVFDKENEFDFQLELRCLEPSKEHNVKEPPRIQNLEVQPGAAAGKHVLYNQKFRWEINKEIALNIINTVNLRFCLLTTKELKEVYEKKSLRNLINHILEWLIVSFCNTSGVTFIWAARALNVYLELCFNKFMQYRQEIAATILQKFESSSVKGNSDISKLNYKSVVLCSKLLLLLLAKIPFNKEKTTEFQSLVRDAVLAMRYKRSLLENICSVINYFNTANKPLLMLFRFMILNQNKNVEAEDETFKELVERTATLIGKVAITEFRQETDSLSFAASTYVEYILTYPLTPKQLAAHFSSIALCLASQISTERCCAINMIFAISQCIPPEDFYKKYVYQFILPLIMELGSSNNAYVSRRARAVILFIIQKLPSESERSHLIQIITKGFMGPSPNHYVALIQFLGILIQFYDVKKLQKKLNDSSELLTKILDMNVTELSSDGTRVGINNFHIVSALCKLFVTFLTKMRSESLSCFFKTESGFFEVFKKIWKLIINHGRTQTVPEGVKLSALCYNILLLILEDSQLSIILFEETFAPSNSLGLQPPDQKVKHYILDTALKTYMSEGFERTAYSLGEAFLKCIAILIVEKEDYFRIISRISWLVRKLVGTSIPDGICRIVGGLFCLRTFLDLAHPEFFENDELVSLLIHTSSLCSTSDAVSKITVAELTPALIETLRFRDQFQICAAYSAKLHKLLRTKMSSQGLEALYNKLLKDTRIKISRIRADRRSKTKLLRLKDSSLFSKKKILKHRRLADSRKKRRLLYKN